MRLRLIGILSLIPCMTFAENLTSIPSTCYGTTAKGHLEHAVQLPDNGSNFESYSLIATTLGRNYVHSQTAAIVIAAYQQLAISAPSKVFKYAETGFKQGGPFKPHKTHQNGLSVDFMVPVLNVEGQSVLLPTHVLNKWGYDIEFDQVGHYQDLTIDYEAMAAHIVELDKAAKQQKLSLWRVIFDPQLQPFLLKTQYGEYLKTNITFSTRPAWVRHDEHYHVDFAIPCLK